jgi:hypothetical protein
MRLNLVHLHGLAFFRGRVRFVAGQAVERLTGRRFVLLVRVEEAKHVIERTVLQHQNDNVLNRGKLVSHGHSFGNVVCGARNAMRVSACMRSEASTWMPEAGSKKYP